MDTLSNRQLNRATLARQLLLERHPTTVGEALEHLVGVQAQEPFDPYYGLFARLEGFLPPDLAKLIEEGAAVRSQLMRATIHLTTARDCLAIHPVTASVLARTFQSTHFAKDTSSLDRQQVLEEARILLNEAPLTRAQLGRHLSVGWPDPPRSSLAQLATYLLPVCQVPPRGVWGKKGQAAWQTIESFLGRNYGTGIDMDELALRYLSAFGPASPRDMANWSRLTGLTEVFDRLRPRLRVFVNEDGGELFDLPDAPRPDPDTPAPPRLLPEYDNVLLGHADRSRVFVGDDKPRGWLGNVLVDGVFAGSWKSNRDEDDPHLLLEVGRLPRHHREELELEGRRVLDFAGPGDDADVRIETART